MPLQSAHQGRCERPGPSDRQSESTLRTARTALWHLRKGGVPQLRFDTREAGETPVQRSERQRDARQEAAEAAFTADPQVRQLMSRYGARLVPDSIRPLDDA